MYTEPSVRYVVDATVDENGVIDNKLPVYTFFDNVLLGKPCSLSVMRHYDYYDNPVIAWLSFDGKTIKFIEDHAHSGGCQEEFNGNNYVKGTTGKQIFYDLYQDNKFIREMFSYVN